MSEDDYGVLGDVVIGLPFVLLSSLLLGPLRFAVRPSPQLWRQLVEAGSPLLLPLSLVVVSGFVASEHFWWAFSGLTTAALGYGARSVLAQVHLSRERDSLGAMARLDGLTGIANRRSFDEALATAFSQCLRDRGWITVVLIDIDHFKRLNDTFGHDAGDAALREVAQAIARAVLRAGDHVARYGGEEFAVILPNTDVTAARLIAERIRAAVEALGLRAAPPAHTLTVSAGAASMQVSATVNATTLLKAADAALYQAKRAGRNRVEVHTSGAG